MSSAWISQQNQQLDLAGGCNAMIPRDFVVWGSCSIPTAPTKSPVESVALTTRGARFWAWKALVLAPTWPQLFGVNPFGETGQLHVQLVHHSGHLRSAYEQNTQQSLGFGFSMTPQPRHW